VRVLWRLNAPDSGAASIALGYAVVALPVAVFAAAAGLYLSSPPEGGTGGDASPLVTPFPTATPVPSASPQPTQTAPESFGAQLIAGLETLPPAAPGAGDYIRAAFGQGWLDPDRNGCDARNDVLARDLQDVRFRSGTNDCVVVAGVLDDPYTSTTIDFVKGEFTSELVQIDHVVPLALAWRSGAFDWDQEQRELFANDPDNLLAVDGTANQEKSDLGPSEWLPANVSYRCEYAQRFTAVLLRYRLAVSGPDLRSLTNLLDRCFA
jgi:hypothetical protein